MGVAFKEVQMGPGIVYFPTVSLQQKEGLVANFGSTPFYYPVHGYHSIQEPPNKEILSVSYLLECKDKLLSLMDKNTIVSNATLNNSNVVRFSHFMQMRVAYLRR